MEEQRERRERELCVCLYSVEAGVGVCGEARDEDEDIEGGDSRRREKGQLGLKCRKCPYRLQLPFVALLKMELR